jgi:hypothetical protein
MSTDIVKMPSTGIIQKIGNQEERGYLVEVYAGMMGIPASQAHKTEVQAVLGKAVQRSVQYGWQPGVHMHTVGFWRKAQQGETPERQDGKVYSISLIDGEKAWWDSAARWRDERGIDWTPKYKPMTEAEVKRECELQSMPFNNGCYGIYCKIVVKNEIDNMLDMYGIDASTPVMDRIKVVNALIDEIPWASGVYTGKKRSGKYLQDDNLPTGTSAKDVAMRRAGKRAIMQSSLTLIPLDNFTDDQRIAQLTAKLREEGNFKEQSTAMIAQKPEPPRESDGSLLFASEGDDIIDGEFDTITLQSLDEVPEMDPSGPVDGDPDWDDIPSATEEKPQTPSVLLFNAVKALFPKDTDDARHWIVEAYTTALDANNVRTSSNDLNDKERMAIVKRLNAKPKVYQDRYTAHVEAQTEAQEGSRPKAAGGMKKAA